MVRSGTSGRSRRMPSLPAAPPTWAMPSIAIEFLQGPPALAPQEETETRSVPAGVPGAAGAVCPRAAEAR